MINSFGDIYDRLFDLIVNRLVHSADGAILAFANISDNILRLDLKGIRITGLHHIYHIVGEAIRVDDERSQPNLEGLGKLVGGGGKDSGVGVGLAGEGVLGQNIIDRLERRRDHWN
jgi:hypothetical protein